MRGPSSVPVPSPAPHPLRHWILRAASGDQRAWGRLQVRYLPALEGKARGYTRHLDDAQDLAILTWEKAYAALPGLSDPDRFDPWLYRLLSNTWIDDFRKRERQPRIVSVDAPIPLDEAQPHAGYEVADPNAPEGLTFSLRQCDEERLWEVLSALQADKPEWARIVARHVFEGVELSKLGPVSQTTRSTYRKALIRLRKALPSV